MPSLSAVKNERRRINRQAPAPWVEYSVAIGVPLGGDYVAALKASQRGAFWAPLRADSWRARPR